MAIWDDDGTLRPSHERHFNGKRKSHLHPAPAMRMNWVHNTAFAARVCLPFTAS